MIRHLESADFKILTSKSFAILHSEESILRQLRVARSKLDLMPNPALRQGMDAYLRELGCVFYLSKIISLFIFNSLKIILIKIFNYRDRISAAIRSTENGRIPLSFDYVIVAEAKGAESTSDVSDKGHIEQDIDELVKQISTSSLAHAPSIESEGIDQLASREDVISDSTEK